MSNHTIKAKNKETGIIEDVNVIDRPYMRTNMYKILYKILGEEDLLEEQQFNDLFEVVEDNVIDIAPELGLDKTRLKPLDFGVKKLNIPQTDTLKKEDWEEKIKTIFIDNEATFCTGDERRCIKDFKNFITQEIAKAREEIVEKVKEYKTTRLNEDSLETCDDILDIIINNK